jgi:DNA-binding HxlR family transcriptional regulator
MELAVSNSCPIRTTLELLGGKWKLLIIKQLADSPKRFAELGRTIPEMSERILSNSLKDLMDSALVDKSESGKQSYYQLTELGKSTLPLLEELAKFGKHYREKRLKT